jgi:hypothetical protein
METVIMHPESKEQLSALKAIARALNVKFQASPYHTEFVVKIKESKKQVDDGKFTVLDPAKSVWENLK